MARLSYLYLKNRIVPMPRPPKQWFPVLDLKSAKEATYGR